MQSVALNSPQQSRFNAVEHMRPGKLFRQPADRHHVLALLTHSQINVSDTAQIWCVVVAASPFGRHVAGALLPLQKGTPVEALSVSRPMLLIAEDGMADALIQPIEELAVA